MSLMLRAETNATHECASTELPPFLPAKLFCSGTALGETECFFDVHKQWHKRTKLDMVAFKNCSNLA